MSQSWSPESLDKIEKIRARYPTNQAAIMPLLWEAQKSFGYLSDETKQLVADTLEVPIAQVQEVATFYIMYQHKPVGKHLIWMCRNLSCQMRGFEEIKEAISGHLKIAEGETTADGEFTLLSNECLGGCGGAPMMQIDDAFYENLSPDTVAQILDKVVASE